MPFKYNAIEGTFDIVNAAGSAGAATSFNTDSGIATPAAGVITIAGGTGIDTSGAGSTVTVSAATSVATSYSGNSGSAVPAANVLTVSGSGGITVTGSGSTLAITYPTKLPAIFNFSGEGLSALETNFATLSKLAGSNVNVFIRAFDTSTEQYVNGKFFVPPDLDTTGTITFRAYVTAATAAASKNIGLTFGHCKRTDGVTWDPASPYTDVDTGAIPINASQNFLTLVTWTVSVSTAAWAANDLIMFRLSRDTSVANNLATSMYLFNFEVVIPRT